MKIVNKGNKVNNVKVFALKEHPNRAYLITQQNVHKFLTEPPYRQNDKFYALCPYCHNPIIIIRRIKQDKGTNRPQMILYGRHLQHPPEGFYPVNKDKLEHCLLITNPDIFGPSLFRKIKVPVNKINRQRTRKALSFLTGIYFSNQLTNILIEQNKPVLLYRLVDQYNFPFVLLIGTRALTINGRKVASNHLIHMITDKARYFSVNSKRQVTKNDETSSWKLKLLFQEQKHDSGDQLYLKTIVEEVNGHNIHKLGSYRIYCRMFNYLIS